MLALIEVSKSDRLRAKRSGVENLLGLEPSVGFLHDFSDYETKQSLVYDMQEPFRWIVDRTLMQASESGELDVPHFYFTGDDYHYRINPEARTRFIGLLRQQFNSGAKYKGRFLKWDTIGEQKAMELGRFLTGRSREVNFAEPCPSLERSDNLVVRGRILSLSREEAAKLGIAKSTRHYLQHKAMKEQSFTVYAKVRERLGG